MHNTGRIAGCLIRFQRRDAPSKIPMITLLESYQQATVGGQSLCKWTKELLRPLLLLETPETRLGFPKASVHISLEETYLHIQISTQYTLWVLL